MSSKNTNDKNIQVNSINDLQPYDVIYGAIPYKVPKSKYFQYHYAVVLKTIGPNKIIIQCLSSSSNWKNNVIVDTISDKQSAGLDNNKITKIIANKNKTIFDKPDNFIKIINFKKVDHKAGYLSNQDLNKIKNFYRGKQILLNKELIDKINRFLQESEIKFEWTDLLDNLDLFKQYL